jgi:hypothetical protein
MNILENIKKWISQGIWFLLIIWLVWATYATLTTVNSWDQLTANKWNDLVALVNQNESSISVNTQKLVNITSNWTNVWIWVATPTSKLDINSWDIKLWWYNVKVNIWSASQTSDLIVNNQAWTSFPWVTKTFNLLSAKTVKLRAYWSTTPSLTTGYTHCWFRFFIDGVWYWYSSWWDQIIGCASSAASVGFRCPWNIEREVYLWAWSHTVNVQMIDRQPSFPGCSNSVQDYSKARLFIEAW